MLWVGIPFRTPKQKIGQLKVHGSNRLTKRGVRLVFSESGGDFRADGLNRNDRLPIRVDRLLRTSEAFQESTRLPVPPVERFGCRRLPAHQNRLLRHTKRFLVPMLILIELPQVPPREGGGPMIAQLISCSRPVMKRLKC